MFNFIERILGIKNKIAQKRRIARKHKIIKKHLAMKKQRAMKKSKVVEDIKKSNVIYFKNAAKLVKREKNKKNRDLIEVNYEKKIIDFNREEICKQKDVQIHV